MSISVKEQHRLGSKVNVGVLDDKGKVIYDRYVDDAAWDTDPEAVAADLSRYLDAQVPAEPPRAAVNKNTVTLDDARVQVKLAEADAAAALALSE